ncbi:MAG TPA: DUF4279 domain-containing protein [Gammaproteobacteria bacterium]
MSDYRFCVSLHVSHPDMELDEFTDLTGLRPFRVWRRGEPRVSPKGTPLEGFYKYNSWAARTHEEEHLFSSELSLEDYIAQLNQRFLQHKNKFAEIVGDGGYIEYFIGWFSEGNISATLEPKLMQNTAELNIAIGLDVYAYEENII